MESESPATMETHAAQRQTPRRTRVPSSEDVWSDTAPGRLRSLGRLARAPDVWRTWQKHLAKRRRPEPLHGIFSGKVHPLLWCAPDETHTDALRELLSALTSTNGRAAEPTTLSLVGDLLQRRLHAEGDSTEALALVAVAHLLPTLAGNLSHEAWWSVLDTLRGQANDRSVTTLGADTCGRLAWADQLLAGELPLTLAYQLPELRSSRDLAMVARTTLSEGLVGLTDGEGLLNARHLSWLRPLLACWTRCGGIARAVGVRAFTEDAEVQYEWVVRQAMRLARSDGSQLLGSGAACQWQPDLFRAALELGGDDEDFAAAGLALPADVKVPDADDLPCAASAESEWAELAVLRPDWSRASPRLVVDFSGFEVSVELEVGRETLLAGPWTCEVVAEGAPLEVNKEWEEVCWHSDDDVDYLEISADLVGGGCIERQILLGREDRFLFLCDNVLNAPAESVEFKSTLPLAKGAAVEFETETCDAVIAARKPRALVLPLALPEWRIEKRFGTLSVVQKDGGQALQLCQRTSGRRLACPLFVDLLPRRLKKQRTWRQLTVAELLQSCTPDTAVAYRVQCNAAQWVFYRSLAPAANRTFFGQNVASEFFAGRFLRDGEVEELLEIEEE